MCSPCREAHWGGRPLRMVSLTLISAGLAGLAVSCVFRFLWVNLPALRVPGQPVTYVHNFIFGQASAILVCIGVGLPWLVSMVQVVQERIVCCVQHRQLGQLWDGLMGVYPELVLNDGRKNEKQWCANSADLYRRYVECRDGLTRLGPYIGMLAGDKLIEEWNPTPQEAARLVERALFIAASSTDEIKLPKEPIFVFAPQPDLRDDDYEPDLNALIKISHELKRGPASGPDECGIHAEAELAGAESFKLNVSGGS
ncbi:MAB_1171c family putative transporter [Arthrobacter sp. lap29]|uniref:MAB_1171c family putative transporter n=1 Tax=Arthrobacter sp. lap29 TaxID=3056122 RepID=UPI0028F6FA2B|nr:MAB_1171c family putative transporter [Arthrobacter sp. lap29]